MYSHAPSKSYTYLRDAARPPGDVSERRVARRVAQAQLLELYAPGLSAFYRGYLTNVSQYGAYLETEVTLPLLTDVLMEFRARRYRGQVCRVHWRAPEERSLRSCGMALRFDEDILEASVPTRDVSTRKCATRR